MAALAAAAALQVGLGIALLDGFRVSIPEVRSPVDRLIDIVVPVQPLPAPLQRPRLRPLRAHSGGSRMAGPQPVRPPPGPHMTAPAIRAASAPSGGSGGDSGAGTASASGTGSGSDDGGSDLELVSGDITARDYPRDLGNRGIGGSVSVRFTVEPNGRADNCRVTRSSGIARLDSLTCALIVARFRFRPSTDRLGRLIADEVDWDQDWDATR